MGYCDTAPSPVGDSSASSQFTWQDGVSIPTSQLQSEASSLQGALSALAGSADSGANAASSPVATSDGTVAGLQPSPVTPPAPAALFPNGPEIVPGYYAPWAIEPDLQAFRDSVESLPGPHRTATGGEVDDALENKPPQLPSSLDEITVSEADVAGSYINGNPQSAITNNSIQDLLSWQMMQQMFASMNLPTSGSSASTSASQRVAPGTNSATSANGTASTIVSSTGPAKGTTSSANSSGPTNVTTSQGTILSTTQSSSSTGLCPNPAAVASMTGPAPGHNVTSASSPDCPGCVISQNAPNSYIPFLIPCSQVPATPSAAMHEATPRSAGQQTPSASTVQGSQAQASSQKATQRAEVSTATTPSNTTTTAPNVASTPQATKLYAPSASSSSKAASLHAQPLTGKSSVSVSAQVTAPPNNEGSNINPAAKQTHRSVAGGNWRPPGDSSPPFLFRSQPAGSLQTKVEEPSFDSHVSSERTSYKSSNIPQANATGLPNPDKPRLFQQAVVAPGGASKNSNVGSTHHTQQSKSPEMQTSKLPWNSAQNRFASGNTIQTRVNRPISTPANFRPYGASLPPQIANRVDQVSRVSIEEKAEAKGSPSFTWKGRYAKASSASSAMPIAPSTNLLRGKRPFKVAQVNRVLPVVQPVSNPERQMYRVPQPVQRFPVTAQVQYQSNPPVQVHQFAQPAQTIHVAGPVQTQVLRPVQTLQIITPVQHVANPPVQTYQVRVPIQTYEMNSPMETYHAVPLQQAPQLLGPVQTVPLQASEPPRVVASSPVHTMPAPVAAPKYVPAPTPAYRPTITFPRR